MTPDWLFCNGHDGVHVRHLGSQMHDDDRPCLIGDGGFHTSRVGAVGIGADVHDHRARAGSLGAAAVAWKV